MKIATYAVVVAILASVTGCSSMQETAAPATPAKWETRTLADGVELRVSPDAGPEAIRVAEMIQSEMRSRYLGAR